jgi:hypothetical protein
MDKILVVLLVFFALGYSAVFLLSRPDNRACGATEMSSSRKKRRRYAKRW